LTESSNGDLSQRVMGNFYTANNLNDSTLEILSETDVS
jgi:hypothetical protein